MKLKRTIVAALAAVAVLLTGTACEDTGHGGSHYGGGFHKGGKSRSR